MRNVVGFTTNFGGPYHFAQADHKSPAQAYGDAPAEGAVAVLRLFARADDHGDVPLNTSGHSSSPSPMSRSRISMWADCSLRRIRPSP